MTLCKMMGYVTARYDTSWYTIYEEYAKPDVF